MDKYVFCLLLCLMGTAGFGAGANNDTTTRQISIMSYNIKMLPRGAVFLHHHPVKRARLIPAKLMEEGTDVVVFEEAFDGLAIRILKRKLKSLYPYCQGMQNRKTVSYKRAGGVLIFSKYPMHEVESIRYSRCKGIDCMGNKGSILVEVEHPVQKFQLLGTHMQAGGSKELKMSQYAEAGELLKRHEQPGVPQFAAGDFNTAKDNPKLYPYLVDALKVEDGEISSDLKFTSDHLLNDMENLDSTKRRVIDFVFYKNNGVAAKSSTRYVKEFQQRWATKHKDLSDHNAIILDMKF
ncbi:MAG: hypothetical protein JWO06_3666 [Bacteroidota bacterium]|nr:hypothetical protein [Bacteroidota bacterium]